MYLLPKIIKAGEKQNMSGIFGNVNTTLLERFEKDLLSFLDNHKEFYGSLIKIIYKYTDNKFRYDDHFSYKYRLLFRLMTDRLRDNDRANNATLIKEMEKDVGYLCNNFEDDYNEFVKKIRLHVDWVTNGYTWAVRIMFGFSVKEALNGNRELYLKRKIILFELLDIIQQNKNINSSDIGNIFYIVHKDVDHLDELIQQVFEIKGTLSPSKQENINKLIKYLEKIHKIKK
jgi:hypothetical protein